MIGNAIKFTEYGIVEISAREIENVIEITISDTGIGIPKNKLADIFQPFVQADGSAERGYKGTGIGLTITKHLVELHGGIIGVKSDPGIGSSFFFSLPISRQSGRKISKSFMVSKRLHEPELLNMSTNKKHVWDDHLYTILIVDDEPTNLQILQNYLAQEPYSVNTVKNGDDALKIINPDSKPDLILLDIMMPGLNGFQVCKEIRKNFSLCELPIIFLTAKTRVIDLVKGYTAGGNDYLTKPFSKDELLSRIRTQLEITLAKDRLISLREFANRIGQIKDSDWLLDSAFQTISTDKYIINTALFKAKRLVLSQGQNIVDLEYNYKKLKLKDEITIISEQDKNFLFARLDDAEDSVLGLQGARTFTDIDIEYVKNILDQMGIIRKNLSKIMVEPRFVSALHTISSRLNDILYIQAKDKYSIIYLENEKEKLIRLSLINIKLYFSDDQLLQIHRSFLVNPKKIKAIEKISYNQFNVNVGKYSLQISKRYLIKIRKMKDNINSQQKYQWLNL